MAFAYTQPKDISSVSDELHYDDYWKHRGEASFTKLKARDLIFLNWIKPNSKVLILGCGQTQFMIDLVYEKSCDVTGVDISSVVVENLKKEGLKAYQADLTDKNFKLNGKYDYIIASEVLEHIATPELAAAKVHSHTHNFIISIPNIAYYPYRLHLFFNGRFPTQWNFHPSEHLRYWSHSDFVNWLEGRKYKIVNYKASNGLEKFKDLWPNLFGHQICYLTQPK